MILRRITANFRRQDWMAVVIELVIVILGVFIGLQVNNWNEARNDRALERQYIQRLHDDFARSIKRAEKNIARTEVQLVLEGEMVGRLRECHLDDRQRTDFAKGVFLVGRFQGPTLVRGTIDELQSTGRIGIIRNLKLRQALSDLVEAQMGDSEVLGYIVARATPQVAYIDTRTVLLQPPGGFTAAPSSDQVLLDFPTLCHDPAYIGAVSTLQELTHVVTFQNQRALAADRAMLKMLDGELGNKTEPTP
ncbi:MAG TPA: hypothetical protein VJQ86_01595 [Rhodanobacteraceae bacterium]|nr:hypothetical protein [Rhodanobacteraceae bacterium]